MLDISITHGLVFFVFGLIIGSFLNVVIYRLPLMLYRVWLTESLSSFTSSGESSAIWQSIFKKNASVPLDLTVAAEKWLAQIQVLPKLGLVYPRSRCSHCGHGIRWYENIPLLSFVLLRGRCAGCGASIGWRYPLVELVTGLLFALCGWRYGLTWTAVIWTAFASMLICQFLIDLDTQYLPDVLNYLLLWLGIVGAALGWTGISLPQSVWGAVAGYLCLWVVFQIHGLIRGKPGMGHGDFKLLAALGAWLGADYLLAIVLVSSLVGSIMGLTMLLTKRLADASVPISFGPYLAGAGLVCLAIGPQTVREWIPLAFPFSALPHS